MQNLTTIGFDADDTLWHNARLFRLTQERFADLLRDHTAPDHLMARLLAAERRNLGQYGFGIKGFVLSMIETAIEVTDQRVPASVIAELLAAGQDMLRHPVDLLPGIRDMLQEVAQSHKIVLITKGDLLDQERKLAQSGLGDLFDGVEIVSDKTARTYATIFARHGDGASRAMMVGDSLRSDVVPAVAAGGWGVHVPHGLAWEIEQATPPTDAPRFHTLASVTELPALVRRINGSQ